MKGDSGSLVVNKDGKAIGQVISACEFINFSITKDGIMPKIDVTKKDGED